MVQKKTTEAAAIDSKKSVNYGTFSASGDFALLPDDILYLVIFFLNAPSTASFKRVCKRFNALATNLDKMIQNNPSMIAAHLSTERLLERINELDKLFSKNILKTKVEINKFVPVIQKELQGLKDKMGDERDAPTKNLTNKLTQLQHKYTFSLGVYTDQLIQKSRRRTKIVDACTVAMLVLGVILLIIGLATRIKWFYIAAAEFLVCSILLFCIHRPCSMLRPNVTREVNEEITQALNKNVMESKILSNLPTFKVAKKL
ncbi:MAG: F-box protein [Coxiellaceae bacterium]|nr:MAG: F-box protein [Coxiellaceae bacterium]